MSSSVEEIRQCLVGEPLEIVDGSIGISTVEDEPAFAKLNDAVCVLILVSWYGFQREIAGIIGVF